MTKVFIAMLFFLLISAVGQAETTIASVSARKPIQVVEYWASWCGSCRQTLPKLITALERLSSSEVTIKLISLDENPSEAQAFLESLTLGRSISIDSLFDQTGEKARAAKLRVMPTTLVLDGTGKERFRLSGTSPRELEKLLRVIQNLLTEQGLVNERGSKSPSRSDSAA